jgi:hypothetical protein
MGWYVKWNGGAGFANSIFGEIGVGLNCRNERGRGIVRIV